MMGTRTTVTMITTATILNLPNRDEVKLKRVKSGAFSSNFKCVCPLNRFISCRSA